MKTGRRLFECAVCGDYFDEADQVPISAR